MRGKKKKKATFYSQVSINKKKKDALKLKALIKKKMNVFHQQPEKYARQRSSMKEQRKSRQDYQKKSSR